MLGKAAISTNAGKPLPPAGSANVHLEAEVTSVYSQKQTDSRTPPAHVYHAVSVAPDF